MGKKKNLFIRFKNELKTYWSVPPVGKYVPYKEYFSIFGAINFNYAMTSATSMISFAASCYLIMYHYNLPYLTYSIITLIGAPLGYPWNVFSWMVADNLGIFPKKTERKFLIFYGTFALVGILLMAINFSFLLPEGSAIANYVNTLAGINTKTIFSIIGVQFFCNGYKGIRDILWRKKLVPKYGRYKYKIYSELWQKAVMFILIGWLPIYKIGDVCERVWILYLLMTLFTNFDSGNHSENVSNQCTPNADERFLIRIWPRRLAHSFKSVLDFLLPVIIACFPDKFADINVYRYVLPVAYIFCAALTTFFAPKIKERIPQPALEKKVQIGFWDGIFGVLRNKYYWIDTITGLLDSLGNGMLNFTTVLLLYTMRADGVIFSAISVLLVFGGTPLSFVAPYFIKKMKYKYMRIIEMAIKALVSFGYVAVFYLCGNQYILMSALLIILKFTQAMATSIPEQAKDEMNLRIRDYQMYISGERLENFKGIFSVIISPITTLTGLIIPIILLKNGYNSNWDILFLDSARFGIISIPILFDALGYVLMIIPYFFWDYDDKKHKVVMEELKRRARLLGGEDFDAETEKARQKVGKAEVAATQGEKTA